MTSHAEDLPRVSWWRAVAPALAAAAANYLLTGLLPAILGGGFATLVFNVLRLTIMAWAGWAVARRAGAKALGCAAAGVLVMGVDHVLLKGGTFLAYHLMGVEVDPAVVAEAGAELGDDVFLLAFFGVLLSFVLFAPLAALAGFLGGLVGRRALPPESEPDTEAAPEG